MNYLDFLRDIEAGNIDAVKEALDRNADANLNVNRTYACGATWILPLPLMAALKSGHAEIAKLLIEKGADLDTVCRKYDQTPRECLPKDFFVKIDNWRKFSS